MSTHSHQAHGGHETQDFEGGYAIWAIPFSLAMLTAFLLVVVLWAPAAATREMRYKEVLGAEAERQSLLEHRAEEAAVLETAGADRIPVKQAMKELAGSSSPSTP